MKKFFKLLVVFFYIIIVGEMSAIAEPASPKPITKKQSDGSTITFILQGDEHVHWAKTLDGYTLLQNGNNDWVYAIRNQLGELVASNVIASNQEERNANQQSFVASLQKDLRFSQSQVASKMKTLGTKYYWDPFPTQGKSKMLVILVEFSDVAFSYTNNDFQNLCSQSGYNGTGSFRDYYYEQSQGQFDVEVTVVGPYTLPNNMAYYGSNTNQNQNYKNFVTDVVMAADSYVDFSQFDNNNDGYVDGIGIFFAGTAENVTSNPDEIWPHQGTRWVQTNDTTADGDFIYTARYMCFAEKRPTAWEYDANLDDYVVSECNITGIGTMCHEFGHMLGLPDMYDTDYAESGGRAVTTGSYDLMAGGNHNNDGYTPCNLPIYEKYMLGWNSLDTLDLTETKNDNELVALTNYNDKGINISLNDDEFYILETRSKNSKWDAYIPSSGMLIYHGTHSMVDNGYNAGNALNVDPSNRGWYIVPSTGETDDGDTRYAPFAGESGITSFSPTSASKPMLKDGTPIDLKITEIAWKNDSTIQFKYNSNDMSIEVEDIEAINNTQDGFTAKGFITSKGNQIITEKGILYSTSNDFDYNSGNKVLDNNLSDTLNISATITGLTGVKYYYRAFAKAGNEIAYSPIKYTYTKVLDIDGPNITYQGTGTQTKTAFSFTPTSNCAKYGFQTGGTGWLSYWSSQENKDEISYLATHLNNNNGYYTINRSISYSTIPYNAERTLYCLAITTSGDSILYKKTFINKLPAPEVEISEVYAEDNNGSISVDLEYTKNENVIRYYTFVGDEGTIEDLARQHDSTMNQVLNVAKNLSLVAEYNDDEYYSKVVTKDTKYEIIVWAIGQLDTNVTKRSFIVTTIDTSICSGDSFKGVTYSTNTTITDIVQPSLNYDSITFINITATPTNYINLTATTSNGKIIGNVAESIVIDNVACTRFQTNSGESIDALTILDAGSINFAATDFNADIIKDKPITVQKNINLKQWSAVGFLTDANENRIYDVLNSTTVFYSNQSMLSSDASIAEIDMTKKNSDNKWGIWEYKRKNDAIPTERGFMVYPWGNKNGVEISDNEYMHLTMSIPTNKVNEYIDGGMKKVFKNNGQESRQWLLYNPFISKINLTRVWQENKNKIQGAEQEGYIYVLNAAGDDYDAIDVNNGNKNYTINPAKTFFLPINNTADEIVVNFNYTNEYPINNTSATNIAKSGETKHNRITFTSLANGKEKFAFARLDENATNGFDRNDIWVMLSLNEDVVQPYFVEENEDLFGNVFSSMPYIADINFHATKQSQTELVVTNIPENIEVSIIDANTNEETILTNGETFNFVANEGENAGRYKVKFAKKSSIEDIENIVNVRFVQNADEVQIFGNDLQNVKVINTLGQTIYNQILSGNEARISNLSTGAYIVKVKTTNGTAIEKIIIK